MHRASHTYKGILLTLLVIVLSGHTAAEPVTGSEPKPAVTATLPGNPR